MTVQKFGRPQKDRLKPVSTGLLGQFQSKIPTTTSGYKIQSEPKQKYPTMPITTRTTAKGIPPRVHQPKQSHKGKKAKKNTRAAAKSSRKRVAT